MTNHRVGKTNSRDPRGWCFSGKAYKRTTRRLLRRRAQQEIRREREG